VSPASAAIYETRCCRAELFEQERGALLARVDACEVQRKDAHALDRENWRLLAEVRELQQVAAPAASSSSTAGRVCQLAGSAHACRLTRRAGGGRR